MNKNDLYDQDLTGAAWVKSSYSEVDMSECVEVADLGGGAVAVRDSNHPGRGDLRFTAGEWAAFTNGVRAGQF